MNKLPMSRILGIIVATVVSVSALSAQTLAIRTNALLWGAEAANFSLDFTVNEFSTVGVTGVFSMVDSWIKDTNLKGAQLEYRYWFSHQPFHSLYLGPIAGVFHYRVEDDVNTQYCAPAGLNIGYAWTLSHHWNVEACYGAGYLFYNRAKRDVLGYLDGQTHHHKFTTINAGLNISYVF